MCADGGKKDESENQGELREGDTIERILVIEFDDPDSTAFDEIMEALKKYPNFDHLHLNEETVLSLPGLEINLDRRKVYSKQNEIALTAKEYDILCLLCANKDRVLTYDQIYQMIWGADALGNERKCVGFHVHNLRKKLSGVDLTLPFVIESIREVGYRIKFNT